MLHQFFFLSTPYQVTKTSWLDHNSSLLLKPSPNLELLVNQFNNATPENSSDPENISPYF